jgi:hypothetical protein
MARRRSDYFVEMLSSCLVLMENGNEYPDEHSFHSVGALHCTTRCGKYVGRHHDIASLIASWYLSRPGSELEGPFAGVEAEIRILHYDWSEKAAAGSGVDTYFGMSLFALEASFS